MNRQTSTDPQTNKDEKADKAGDQGALEKIAQTIDPSGREISDAELIDPGANIPDSQSGKGAATR